MTEDKRRKLEDAISELDLRLDGLLGKLGASLGDMIDNLDQGEDGEIRRSHEIRTPKGPLRAETGIRVRVGGAAFGERAGATGGQRPVAWKDAEPDEGVGTRSADAAGQTHASAETSEDGDAANAGGAARAARTPHLETYAVDGRWHLCADLPGVTLADVDVAIEPSGEDAGGKTLMLTTRGARRYAFEYALPQDADPEDMSLVLRNGVLEIGFGRAGTK